MSFIKLTAFTKKVADLADQISGANAADIKSQFDAAPEELRTYFNNLVDALKSTASGDSGAKNTGATAISGLTGTDVQSLLNDIGTKLIPLVTAPTIQFPSLLNGWVNNDTTYVSHYYKTGDGNVHFYICAKNGTPTLNTVITNLPSGYRPVSPMMLRGYSDGGGDIVYHVHTGGEIKFLRNFTYSSGNFIILQGSFQAGS